MITLHDFREPLKRQDPPENKTLEPSIINGRLVAAMTDSPTVKRFLETLYGFLVKQHGLGAPDEFRRKIQNAVDSYGENPPIDWNNLAEQVISSVPQEELQHVTDVQQESLNILDRVFERDPERRDEENET